MPSHDRSSISSSRVGSALAAWFLSWRLLLAQALSLPVRAARALRYSPRPGVLSLFLRAPERSLASVEGASARVAAFGVRAFIAGMLGLFALAVSTGGDPAVAGTQAVTSAVWALARLGMLVFFARGGRDTRSAVLTAWAAGLFPYLIGVTAGLRLAAFIVSAIYTEAALVGVGIDRRRSLSLVAQAFGAQAIIVGLAWGVRAVLTLIISVGATL
jgi:hypothetical protein